MTMTEKLNAIQKLCVNSICKTCPCREICKREEVFVRPFALNGECLNDEDGVEYVNKIFEKMLDNRKIV